MSGERTIVLKTAARGHHDEGTLANRAGIYPGMSLELNSSGLMDWTTVAKAEALKRNSLRIAKEDTYQGRSVDVDYDASSRVFWYIPVAGDIINLRCKSGENLAVNDVVVEEGGGSGLFVEASGSEARYRAKVLESTGGALAADGLVKCEIL